MHQIHVTDNKVECGGCHIEIEHHLSASVPRQQQVLGEGSAFEHGGMCSQCHSLTHAGPDELYRGTGGRGVPDMPSPMFRAQVDCIACHRERSRSGEIAQVVGQTYVAIQQSCDDCHGNRYREALDLWKTTISEHLRKAQIATERASDFLANAQLPPSVALESRRLLADAEHNLRFVKLARGVHNVNYATALLNVAIENCQRITGSGGSSDVHEAEDADAKGARQ
jgi:hypothetical protein